ncbi:hypothetical protein ACVIGB_004314 [Bradyrhizobium sp. USDA 4341]
MAIPCPGSDRPAATRPAAPAEDGESLLFCLPARNAAAWRQGKKAGAAVAGRRSRLLPPLGLDQPNRDCVERVPTTELTEISVATAPGAASDSGWIGRKRADVRASLAARTQPDQRKGASHICAQRTHGTARIVRPNAFSTGAVKTRSELPRTDLCLAGQDRRHRDTATLAAATGGDRDGSCPRSEKGFAWKVAT